MRYVYIYYIRIHCYIIIRDLFFYLVKIISYYSLVKIFQGDRVSKLNINMLVKLSRGQDTRPTFEIYERYVYEINRCRIYENHVRSRNDKCDDKRFVLA